MTLRILRRFDAEPERGFPCVVEAEVNGVVIAVIGDNADVAVRLLAEADQAGAGPTANHSAGSGDE